MRVAGLFDLTSLARSLRDTGRHPALVNAIDRAVAAGSLCEDLRTVLHPLQTVAIQDRGPAGREGALLTFCFPAAIGRFHLEPTFTVTDLSDRLWVRVA